MRYIKMLLFFLGALFGIALTGFFGLVGIIGIYGIFVTLWEYCPNILIGSGLFLMGVLFVPVGWGIFCKFADKLKDS
jgi:hypothetical protein